MGSRKLCTANRVCVSLLVSARGGGKRDVRRATSTFIDTLNLPSEQVGVRLGHFFDPSFHLFALQTLRSALLCVSSPSSSSCRCPPPLRSGAAAAISRYPTLYGLAVRRNASISAHVDITVHVQGVLAAFAVGVVAPALAAAMFISGAHANTTPPPWDIPARQWLLQSLKRDMQNMRPSL